ncbi:MAG TPA: COX15/CtaA family protein [Pseudonocardia sp.]|nr:COX15/CtaA family protein [Pseudonocardia sp.]
MARPALLDRLAPVPPAVMRRLAVAAVVAQAGIAVTGSIVRVTGSGLGCPTWPQCFPGSLVPTPHPEVAALHQWVEFGNRLLTFAVVAVTGLCFLAALGCDRSRHDASPPHCDRSGHDASTPHSVRGGRPAPDRRDGRPAPDQWRPRRSRLVRLALVQPLGVVAQAVIGGFTVLLGLVWWSVSVHFLVSMVLVWLAVVLVDAATPSPGSPTSEADGGQAAGLRVPTAPPSPGSPTYEVAGGRVAGLRLTTASGEGDGPPRPVVPRAVRALVGTSTAVLGALLLAGTFVTAAGPHSGDADTPRLAAGVPAMAQLHADLLFGYLGLLVGLGFALRAVTAPAGLLRRYAVLVAAVLLQGVVGGVQYALGVPEALASLHVLGAALVTVAAAAVWTGTAPRGPVEARPAPPHPGDAIPAEPPLPRGATSPDVADRPALAERN